MNPRLICGLLTALVAAVIAPSHAPLRADSGFRSFDTGHTICKVRTAVGDDAPYIVASTYEGAVLGMSFAGERKWLTTLNGCMNRDLWCADLDGDRRDEILVASADGALYCLDGAGRLRWQFKCNDAPMNAVCTVTHGGNRFVICGGYDTRLYYLDAAGKLVKTIASESYSRERAWGKPGERRFPKARRHIANFIRVARGPDHQPIVGVHGILNSNTTTGSVYLFKPLAEQPYQVLSNLPGKKPYGDLAVCDSNNDGVDELLLGTSTTIQDSHLAWMDLQKGQMQSFDLAATRRHLDGNGYRVAQTVAINDHGRQRLLTSFGARLIVAPLPWSLDEMEFLSCGYSFNDVWQDTNSGKVVFASAQSGGSCVHVLDPSCPDWRQAFAGFRPQGKLKAILDNTAAARAQLQRVRRIDGQQTPRPVYMMTESLKGDVEQLALGLERQYGVPIFLQGHFMRAVEQFDRSGISSKKYRQRRDRRKSYTLSQQQVLDEIVPLYRGGRRGVAFWGGHGNDPYMFSTGTMKKIAAAAGGKISVFIYPELEAFDDEFALVLKEHFYPMAEFFRGKNAYIYVRTKHAFWQSIVYLPMWSRLASGEFADVFIPSMEETTDKTMEQTIAGRLGIWASGAVDQWGSRCARDNASFDRLRQHAHQMVPNHFLRTQIYHIAYGATFQNNYPVDQEYFSFLYELIAKGALYVPRREEIISFSPVHVSIANPDPHYVDEGNNAKWLTFFGAEFEQQNPMVFSRLNGTWPGGAVTAWDFSRYAAGVHDRRLHFLPPYANGLVLITPPQQGTYADGRAPRGRVVDHLHPLYRNIMKEYITDGRSYLSADGRHAYRADEYYRQVAADIRRAADQLPCTVNGGVAWVAAQSAPRHIRLTLIDSGYINPQARTAHVHFHTVRPVAMTDLLSSKRHPLQGEDRVELNVPCGLFRLLDIELASDL